MSSTTKYLSAKERRAVTVQTVLALAGEQNPSEITTAAIAERMGLTQGAIFRHFPTKDAILVAVMDWVTQHLLSTIDQAAGQAPSPLAALEAMFMAHARFVTQHPGVPRLLFGELQRPMNTEVKSKVQFLVQQYSARLQTCLQEGLSQDELDQTLDLQAAASLFLGTIQGLVMQAMIIGNAACIYERAPQAFALYKRSLLKA